jgi:hypothetical protein
MKGKISPRGKYEVEGARLDAVDAFTEVCDALDLDEGEVLSNLFEEAVDKMMGADYFKLSQRVFFSQLDKDS